MGVKSTTTLTRTEAINLLADKKAEIFYRRAKPGAVALIEKLSDSVIQDLLERATDELYGGKVAVNYRIVPDDVPRETSE